MDWVIPVRVGEPAEELRYTLRSIAANVPHDRVWLVGYRPSWVRGVRHVPTRQIGSKYRNTTLAVRTACEHPEISDPFILANDDMFVLRPIEEVPVLHRGPVRDVEAYYEARRSGNYLRGMRETRALLAQLGHPDPLSYELHIPLPVSKKGMLRALDLGRRLDVLHKRTAYGVINRIGGEQCEDVKLIDPRAEVPQEWTFLSTLPSAWRGEAGRHVRARFPHPSKFEGAR